VSATSHQIWKVFKPLLITDPNDKRKKREHALSHCFDVSIGQILADEVPKERGRPDLFEITEENEGCPTLLVSFHPPGKLVCDIVCPILPSFQLFFAKGETARHGEMDLR